MLTRQMPEFSLLGFQLALGSLENSTCLAAKSSKIYTTPAASLRYYEAVQKKLAPLKAKAADARERLLVAMPDIPDAWLSLKFPTAISPAVGPDEQGYTWAVDDKELAPLRAVLVEVGVRMMRLKAAGSGTRPKTRKSKAGAKPTERVRARWERVRALDEQRIKPAAIAQKLKMTVAMVNSDLKRMRAANRQN